MQLAIVTSPTKLLGQDGNERTRGCHRECGVTGRRHNGLGGRDAFLLYRQASSPAVSGFLADDASGSVGTHLAEYTYLGLGMVVQVDYPEPDLRLDLAHGGGADPYDGLDRFDCTYGSKHFAGTPRPLQFCAFELVS
jgi:hypothetical protein